MNDARIREVLCRTRLSPASLPGGARVIHELGVCEGAVRVDVAVVGDTLHGYEIKSERDTLRRLPAQVRRYGGVFDGLTLVVSASHAIKAEAMIPPWWGLILAAEGPIGLVLDEIRAPAPNPGIRPRDLVRLLWRAEALQFLRDTGNARGMSKANRSQIYRKICDSAGLDDIRGRVRGVLRTRTGWAEDR